MDNLVPCASGKCHTGNQGSTDSTTFDRTKSSRNWTVLELVRPWIPRKELQARWSPRGETLYTLIRGCQDDVLNQPQEKFDCKELGDASSINHAKGTVFEPCPSQYLFKNAANIVMVMNAMELHGVTLLTYSQPEMLKNVIPALIST